MRRRKKEKKRKEKKRNEKISFKILSSSFVSSDSLTNYINNLSEIAPHGKTKISGHIVSLGVFFLMQNSVLITSQVCLYHRKTFGKTKKKLYYFSVNVGSIRENPTNINSQPDRLISLPCVVRLPPRTTDELA